MMTRASSLVPSNSPLRPRKAPSVMWTRSPLPKSGAGGKAITPLSSSRAWMPSTIPTGTGVGCSPWQTSPAIPMVERMGRQHPLAGQQGDDPVIGLLRRALVGDDHRVRRGERGDVVDQRQLAKARSSGRLNEADQRHGMALGAQHGDLGELAAAAQAYPR